MALWRLFHFGPIIAIVIIKCITFTTLHYFAQWCLPFANWFCFCNHLLYYVLIAITSYNFLCSIFIGPGSVPANWRPVISDDEKYVQYCHQCESFKAPRSHHCSKCKKCILKMDHHCPWINNCCGYYNQKSFFYFLLSAVVGSIYSLILLCISLYRALYFIPNANSKYIHLTIQGFFLILFSIGMSLGVIIAVGGLLYLQAKILLRNRTSIEDWILTKAKMRPRDSPFVYPYNLGVWKNIKQVLFMSLLDGITWPVVEGCDQYTLTHEQIQQKREKLQNSSIYRVTSAYNGRFFPLFSQGFRVCISFPINDDPRLVVNPDDEILVTHWHKRWLYGQKIVPNDNPKIRQKGWIPEQCAVRLVKCGGRNKSNPDETESNANTLEVQNKKDA